MGIPLETRDVHIHYRSIGQMSREEHIEAVAMLSADEVERAQRLVFPRDRVVYLAAHALLRQVLSHYERIPSSAWTFEANSDGKPVLGSPHRATSLCFNLTHTTGLVACVVGRARDVGIDVESLDARVDWFEIASRFFSTSEVTSLHSCVESERHARFVELWTLKEAYIKAMGTGLSTPLQTFAFVYEGAASLRLEPAVGSKQSAWQFALFAPTARHRMAVAARRSARETLRITTWCDFSRCAARTVRTSVDQI
jgi:4'-phosphopantetheinyl transferase